MNRRLDIRRQNGRSLGIPTWRPTWLRLGRSVLSLLLLLVAHPVWAAPRLWVPGPGSEVRYRADHTLHEIVGRSAVVEGVVHWDPDQPLAVTGVVGKPFGVPVTSFDSGNRNRDANFCALLRCDRFPKLHFVPEAVTGVTWSGDGGEAYVRGRLYVAGRKRRITIPVHLRRPQPDRLELTSRFVVRLSEFAIEPPRLLFLAVADPVEVEVRLSLVPAEVRP